MIELWVFDFNNPYADSKLNADSLDM